MNIELPVIIISYFVVMGFFHKVFKEVDDGINSIYKRKVSNRLKGLSEKESYDWIPDFALVFDSFFGEKLFQRSLVISFSLTIITSLILIFARLESSDIANIFLGWSAEDLLLILILSLSIASLNSATDYISLIQTRYFIKVKLPLILKLLFDFIATLLIAPQICIIFFGFEKLEFSWYLIDGYINFYSDIINAYQANDNKDLTDFTWGIIASFITTFFTSIWLWLYGAANILIKLMNSIPWIMKFLNVEEKPFFAIGITINCMIFMSMLIVLPMYLFL